MKKKISIALSFFMISNMVVFNNVAYGGSVIINQNKNNQQNILIDNFESNNINWKSVDGYQYNGGIKLLISKFNNSNAMKVDLDYTNSKEISWSEAKISKIFDKPYSLNGNDYFTMDFYYPNNFNNFAIKVFANDILDNELIILSTEKIDNNYTKAKLGVRFSAKKETIDDLTIGIVGKNTDFKGSVYIDNIQIEKYDSLKDFVEIKSKIQKQIEVNLDNLVENVKIADKDASVSAKYLLAYLTTLKNNNQVLFGHQNDYNKMVSSTAKEGDVKEITGSLSGVYGIDTLSLTGAELGIKDREEALNISIQNSKNAAKQGAIITLSTHMPNFTSSKITKNENGLYDFTICDFSESKDLSNNCAEQILPGGAYNEQLNQYLDIIASYALALQEENIPVLFRPYHEDSGNWFWWGLSTNDTTYKSLFRYTADYLKNKNVHNILYVYSPNGPIESEASYLKRYPGDEYVDILAFDYYNDYSSSEAEYSDEFFINLDNSCKVVTNIAEKRGKLSAIAETGVRVTKRNGSNEGLLISGNPVSKEKSNKNWYQEVNDIAKKNNMPYYLVWANFGDTNFYVPYKYNENYGHEMINEFIDYYNDDSSVFANETNFYKNIKSVKTESYNNVSTYILRPFNQSVIKEETELLAGVNNGKKVQFIIENLETNKSITIDAVKNINAKTNNEYKAKLTADHLKLIGTTNKGTIKLMVDGKITDTLKNISFNKDKLTESLSSFESFEIYLDDDNLLDNTYSHNSASNCFSSFSLEKNNKNEGTYGGKFHYELSTSGNEVWTGQIKTLENNDFSKYNAMQFWVKPDGLGQKLVIQITTDSGEDFEVYLTDFVKTKDAKYVTVPFSSFKGKNGGELDTSKITKFAIWCNSIVPENFEGKWEVNSDIYFDDIKAVNISNDLLKNVDKNGLIITDKKI